MLRRLASLLAVPVLLAGAVVPLAGQSISRGSVRGMVQDDARAALHDVRVVASEQGTGVSSEAVSDRQGRFELEHLAPGDYEVLVERLGYRPRRIRDVPVRPGRALDLGVVLSAAAPPFDQVEVTTFSAPALGSSLAGAGQWLGRPELEWLPEERRAGGGFGRLSPRFGPLLEVDGLPFSMTGIAMDGVPVGTPGLPLPMAGVARATQRSSRVGQAELLAEATDVEWGEGGGVLHLLPRRGTRELAAQGYGGWSGDALSITRAPGPVHPSYQALEGGALVSGPLQGERARFALGFEGMRLDLPFAGAEGDSLADRTLGLVREALGVAPNAPAAPRQMRTEMLTAFGNLDWRLAADHELSTQVSLRSIPLAEAGSASPGLLRQGPAVEGTELAATASLASALSARVRQELRLGFQLGRWAMRSGAAGGLLPAGQPGLRIAGSGIFLGSDPELAERHEQTTLRLGETLHYRGEGYRLKGGISLDVRSHDYAYPAAYAGEFLFADGEGFLRREGLFRQRRGPAAAVAFSAPGAAAFLQSTWNPHPGLDLTGGVRYEVERLPYDRLSSNPEWTSFTGIEGGGPATLEHRFAPRLSFTWDPGAAHLWRLRGAAGVHHTPMDPRLLADLLANGVGRETRVGLGELSQWPLEPGLETAPALGPALLLAGPGLASPRTARGSLGVSRFLGGETALHLSGTYHRTSGLPRHRDLNLLPEPDGSDQHGRPVFGTLVQRGGLLAAAPGSNRRFTGFGEVIALEADGELEHAGVTVQLERAVGSTLRVLASYTASRTTDDWPLAGESGLASQPLPALGEGLDWARGRSDLDVPHRVAAAGSLRLPGRFSPQLAAVYRYRSGVPFTPGLRAGVDMNGDGVADNDPAFVDSSVAGLAAVLAGWACLQGQVGVFAERNSCRGPGIHSLDLRFGLPALRLGRYSAEMVVDALHLLRSGTGELDRALFLLDPAAQVTTDPATGRVTVPLVANPAFGQPFARYAPDRMLRIGFQLLH